MPIITLQMLEGRTPKKKAELAEQLTQTVSRILSIEPERITCVIEDVPTVNWARGGTTMVQQFQIATPGGEVDE